MKTVLFHLDNFGGGGGSILRHINIFIAEYFWEEAMDRKSNLARVIFSGMISLALMFSAIFTTAAYASPPSAKATPPQKATPTPVVTDTPVPTVEPVETVPALALQTDQTYIIPGGQIVLTYQITDFQKIVGTPTLRFYAPIGLTPVNLDEGKWDEAAGTFTLSAESEGKILWQADATIAPPVTLFAELIQKEETISKAEILLDAMTEFKVEASGGEANGMNGKVQVSFPGGAVSETVMVKVTRPSEEALPIPSLSGAPFEITASSDSSKIEVSQFSQPIEIIVSYSDAGMVNEGSTMLYWYDEVSGEWKLPLSQRLDTVNNKIVATTDHFTVFDTYTSNWQSAETPTLSYFQTPGFTGAASFSMPIKVPPGPGGLQPSLSLSYSSSTADNVANESQASWAGMGWSIAESYIEHNNNGTQGAPIKQIVNGQLVTTPRNVDDTFQLTLNGTSIRLFKDANGIYHAEDEQFYKVSHEPGSDTWEVWDKSGTKYTFGLKTPQFSADYDEENNCHLDQTPWRWSLSEVRNIYGQTMTYSYATETKAFGGCGINLSQPTYTYPQTITYSGGKYRVYFDRLEASETNHRLDLKNIWTAPTSYQSFQRSLLEAIRVEQDANGDGAFETLIRKYQFTYCQSESCSIFPDQIWEQGGRTPTLVSVQEFGLNGTNSLPAYTFNYADGMHLTSASNGYGGSITYIYNNQTNYALAPQNAWHDSDGGNPREYNFEGKDTEEWTSMFLIGNGQAQMGTATTQNTEVKSFQPGRWYKLEARAKATAQSGTHTLEFGYTYKLNGAWVADTFFTPVTLTQSWADYESPAFFLPVDATDFMPKIRSVKSNQFDWIYLTPLTTVSRVTSRTLSTGSDNYTFNYTYENPHTNDPTVSAAAQGTHPYEKAYTSFRGHSSVTEQDPYGNQTVTAYYQDDILVGRPNTITVKDSFGANLQTSQSSYDSSTLCTVTLIDVSDKYDQSTWLQPYDPLYCRWTWTESETKTVYQADGSTEAGSMTTTYGYESTYGNLVSQTVSGSIPHSLTTHYEYYNNTSGGNYIVGLPSRVWMDNGINTLSETINVFDGNGILAKTRTLMSSGQYSQATFGYDVYGNITSLTTYSGYSDGVNDPVTGARTATTIYDSTYHTYPISITTPPTDLLPSGLTTTLTYNYSLGLPVSETGPNGAATKVEAEYDSFGRLVKLIRPGDDSASPTLSIVYSTGSPFTTTLTQKIQNGQFYTVTRAYDGLGRPASTSAGGTTTLYDYDTVSYGGHLYRQDKVSTPFASGESYFWATTMYDGLGRPLLSTSPDGTTASFAYNGFETTVTDGNGNVTKTTTDILGLTRFVDAPTGPDIVFDYDDLGNLKTATRGGVTTFINYDLGGRKTSMSDPDMGNWSYEYDALGNLKLQTDARGCVTNLNYDNLNRLKQKTYSNCPSTPTVTYGYDSGTYGKGFRTSMSDGSGSSSWDYDERGRLKNESKTIGGGSPFITEWTYNSADLPKTMKYPDNEIVTYNYDNRMLLISVLGNSAYVSDTDYDSAGRMTSRLLGNGLTQTYGYYDWNEKVNNIGQGGRLETLTTGSLQNLSYVYDAVGNVKQITNSVASETNTYEYDSINRLTNWTLNGQTKTYSYDDAGNLSSKEGMTLNYNDANHVHAVSDAGSNSYSYDANGNQTIRVIGNDTFNLSYDTENRLVEVKKNNTTIALFTYDGDGRRVKSVADGETILFVGGYYEKKGAEITKYYPGGAIRKYVIPQSMSVEYVLGDHLGSASVMTDSLGNKVSEMRYSPWGEVRYSWVDSNLSTTPAYTLPKQTFTGQHSYMDDPSTQSVTEGFGLMFYQSRFYDPALGRMVQADSIVPGGLQGLDRYAYVNNAPVRYVDPSGHFTCVNQTDGAGHMSKQEREEWQEYCQLVVEDYLRILETKGGQEGKDLAAAFRAADNPTSCAPHPGGVCTTKHDQVTVYVVEGEALGGAVAQYGYAGTGTIAISEGMFHRPDANNVDDLVNTGFFGHEIVHMQQDPFSHSLVSEIEAYDIQYRLYQNMGIGDRTDLPAVRGAKYVASYKGRSYYDILHSPWATGNYADYPLFPTEGLSVIGLDSVPEGIVNCLHSLVSCFYSLPPVYEP